MPTGSRRYVHSSSGPTIPAAPSYREAGGVKVGGPIEQGEMIAIVPRPEPSEDLTFHRELVKGAESYYRLGLSAPEQG